MSLVYACHTLQTAPPAHDESDQLRHLIGPKECKLVEQDISSSGTDVGDDFEKGHIILKGVVYLPFRCLDNEVTPSFAFINVPSWKFPFCYRNLRPWL